MFLITYKKITHTPLAYFPYPLYTPSPAVMVGEGVWGYDVFYSYLDNI
nr:MAG TPA: hypothetical protein [Caudoviricetes sp.]